MDSDSKNILISTAGNDARKLKEIGSLSGFNREVINSVYFLPGDQEQNNMEIKTYGKDANIRIHNKRDQDLNSTSSNQDSISIPKDKYGYNSLRSDQIIDQNVIKPGHFYKMSNKLKELPELERRIIENAGLDNNGGLVFSQEDENYIKTVYDHGLRKRVDPNNSYSPLLRKSQVKKFIGYESAKDPADSQIQRFTYDSIKNIDKRYEIEELYDNININEYSQNSGNDYKQSMQIGSSSLSNKTAKDLSDNLKGREVMSRDSNNNGENLNKYSRKLIHHAIVENTSSKSYLNNDTESKVNNLPVIQQNKLSKVIRKDSTSVPMKKRDSKKLKPSEVVTEVKNPPSQPPSESKSQVAKDTISKRQRLKRDTTSGAQKNKFQTELTKLKQSGALKYLPKLSVETPFMAKRVKFVDKYIEDDPKWTQIYCLTEEYIRKDQLRQIDKYMKNSRVVYDQAERSPFYSESDSLYIDEKKLIPVKESEEVSVNPRFKSRGFKRNIISNSITKKDRIYTSLNPFYVVQDENDNTLVFEGRFESGNLKRVVQIDDYEYDVFLRNDYNSQGYTQWYFFSVSNTKPNTRYIFNLKNFFKPDSLYNQGMKPLIYSTKKAEEEGIGWYRGGDDICYYPNGTKRKCGPGNMCSLTFSAEFQYEGDEVFFSHCFPFTYRDCKEHLDTVCNDSKKDNKTNMSK